jgi:DNA modification methylase
MASLKDFLFHTEPGIEVYCGDCREVLPLVPTADLLLTDPPYGIGASKVKRGGRQDGKSFAPSRTYESSDWDNEPADEGLLRLAISKARHAIIWGGNYFSLGPNSCWLVWDKETGANGYADAELAWTNIPGAVRLIRHQWKGMFQAFEEDRWHPTQKPVPVMRWAITRAGDVKSVLDCFMGSGSSLIASKEMGISVVGIEIEPKYCEIAVKRLRQEVLAL